MNGNSFKEKYWKYGLILSLLFLGYMMFKEFLPFLGGLLGACTIYILVRKQMARLTEVRKLNKSLAAAIVLVEVILCFFIPVFFLGWLAFDQVQQINLNPDQLIASINHFSNMFTAKTGYNLFSKDNISTIATYSTKVGQIVIGEASGFVINSAVMFFVLFFMLLSRKEMEAYLFDIMPFNDTNKKKVLHKVDTIVKSNAIGIPVLAIIQGTLATIAYVFFDVPKPILLGFITCFATIIPIFGTSLVWLPAAIYLAVTGDWSNAIGLVIYSVIIIGGSDNLVRFMLQKKIANIHPLITIFGVIIGLALFGFWGVIFGPLLMSMFLLLFNMFKENYLDVATKKE